MQDTRERADERIEDEAGGRALARRDQRERSSLRAQRSSLDLDEVPIYASTGIRRIFLGKSGTYWIEIQQELDFGQQTILDNASVIGVQREQMEATAEAGQTVRLDLTRQRFLLCAIWLTRWAIPKDEEGKEIRLPRHVNDRIETLKRLNPRWGDAIVTAITEHIAEQQEEEQEANEKADQRDAIDGEARESENPPPPPLNGASSATSSPLPSASSPAGVADS